MDAFEPNILGLTVFAIAWAILCIGGVLMAGMLPLSAAPVAARTPSGIFLVAVNLLLLAGLLVLTLAYSYAELRWSSAVVVGGMIFLFAPFAVQDLPDFLKNGRAGLMILLVLVMAALALLYSKGALQGVMQL